MSAIKYIIFGAVFFVIAAIVYLAVFEYRADAKGNHGWHFKYSNSEQVHK